MARSIKVRLGPPGVTFLRSLDWLRFVWTMIIWPTGFASGVQERRGLYLVCSRDRLFPNRSPSRPSPSAGCQSPLLGHGWVF